MKDPKYHYGLMKKVMKPCISQEDKWNEHAWLINKFHIERNLHYEIVIETKFVYMKNLSGLVYDATTLFYVLQKETYNLQFELVYSIWLLSQNSIAPSRSLALPIFFPKVCLLIERRLQDKFGTCKTKCNFNIMTNSNSSGSFHC